MKRREFVWVPLAALASPMLAPLARMAKRSESSEGLVQVSLRFFTAAEARTVAAACERIIPRDENGPGATDAGVVIYIDRQLAGPYGQDKYRYTKGPFTPSIPEHGYQGRETPREIYRAGIRALGAFAAQSSAKQDDALTTIEKTPFFALLRKHT